MNEVGELFSEANANSGVGPEPVPWHCSTTSRLGAGFLRSRAAVLCERQAECCPLSHVLIWLGKTASLFPHCTGSGVPDLSSDLLIGFTPDGFGAAGCCSWQRLQL